MARNIADETVGLVETQIRNNIATALADIRSDRADPFHQTPLPQAYFRFFPARVLQQPAVFTIVENIDFNKEVGANHINAIMQINVAVMLEDQLHAVLTQRAYRYQAALHQVLDQKSIVSADEEVKIVVLVTRATFSPIYTEAGEKGNAAGVFRKEVVLECTVRHFENF